MGSLSHRFLLNTSQRFFKQETVCSPSGSGAGFWVVEQMFWCRENTTKTSMDPRHHWQGNSGEIRALGEVVLVGIGHLGVNENPKSQDLYSSLDFPEFVVYYLLTRKPFCQRYQKYTL